MQDLQQAAPTLIVKLLQRRLLDKNAEITVDEILEAHQELGEHLCYLQHRMEVINACQEILERIVKKKDLFIPNFK